MYRRADFPSRPKGFTLGKAIKALIIAMVLAVIVFVFQFLFFRPGAQAIYNGTTRDIIYSVEPRLNGTIVLWMRNDEKRMYCTKDRAVIDRAYQYYSAPVAQEVLLVFRSINYGDPEFNWFGVGGCNTGDADDNETVLLECVTTPDDLLACGITREMFNSTD